jgi:phospholipid-binding lipoprotein MlaA
MSNSSLVPNAGIFLGTILLSGLIAGCASSPEKKTDDPWSGWNHKTQSFNDKVDEKVLKPVARGYLDITSDAVDEGVTNFFSNFNDIGVSINDFLQFKLLQGGMDVSRFVVNTTVGVVGIFDVAKKINLPKHNEDFGQTLGFWGVPSGNFLVLPFFGASNPRDAVGRVGDALFDPLTYTFMFSGGLVNAASVASSALDVTDTRAGMMMSEKLVNEASVDKYEFIKNAYQQRREYLIHDGNPPESDNVQLDEDDVFPDTKAVAKKATTVGIAPAGSTKLENVGGLPPVIDNSKNMKDLVEPENYDKYERGNK